MYSSDNLKKIWDVELDLLEEFKRVCNKYNITYWASSGTLLGAVRHNGFIPWDDDIDVFLMWSDYKKLMKIAQSECSYPYCFQSIYSEPDAMPSACRLRRSDTTGFTKWELQNVGSNYDRGIFIDIFPLFYVPDSLELRKKQFDDVIFFWKSIHGYDAVNQRLRGRYVNADYERYIPTFMAYCEMIGTQDIDIVKLKEKYLNVCAMVNTRTKEVGATSSKCHRANLMWNTEWFDNYIDLPFEDTTIRCPIDYEKVLEKQYGDWRTHVKGTAVHEMVVVDTKTPWREFDMSSLK